MPAAVASSPPLQLAIIGGGITGITLALGLLRRGIDFRIYERAREFREIGAGIGFTPNAERAMLELDPRVYVAFKAVATPNGDPQNTTDWFQWVDGYHSDGDSIEEELLFKMYLGKRGFEGCNRADFLNELIKHIPKQYVLFNHELDTIVDRGDEQRLLLKFADGTEKEADAVLGCDGIRSRVRQLILGEDNPASYARYSHKKAYRGLVPMKHALEALGEEKSMTRFMHLGQDAHILTFPVAMGALMNVVAFVSDPNEWPYKDKLSAAANKTDAVVAFSGHGGAVRAIINLLPEEINQWAVFDTYDHPISMYRQGRICIVGDAAHASAPHHGAGAGMGVEDATVLAGMFEIVATTLSEPSGKSLADVVRAALAAYETVRLPRSRWVVESSRILGEIYEWQYAPTGQDKFKCEKEVNWRSLRIWDYDINEMMRQMAEEYQKRLKTSS